MIRSCFHSTGIRRLSPSAIVLVVIVLAIAPRSDSQTTAPQPLEMVVDMATAGPKIDRNIFGQFAEHLGRGIYEGVWVGPDSSIPNTRGIRNDVVSALKALKVPNVDGDRVTVTVAPKSVTVIAVRR